MIGALLVALLGAGCAGGSDDPPRSSEPEGASGRSEASSSVTPSPTPSNTPRESATPSTPIDVDNWLDTAEAEDARRGAVLEGTTRVVPPRTAEIYYVGLDVGAPGKLLASRNTLSASGDESLGTPHLGWLSASGFEPLPYDDADSANRQVTYAEVEGDTVTWVETSSTDLFRFDWQVYTAVTGEPGRKLCADSTDLYGTRPLKPVFGGTKPASVGAGVYWTGTTPGDQPTDSHVFVCRDGETRIAVDRAALVTSDGKDVFYVRGPQTGTQQGASTQIVRRRRTDSKESVVVDIPALEREVTALDASSTHVAWVVSTSEATAELFVKNLDSGSIIGVQLDQAGDETMFLSVGTNAVVWGNGSSAGDAGQYLLALDAEELWRLGEAPGYSIAYATGNSIAWSKLVAKEGAPPATVFETATYPDTGS